MLGYAHLAEGLCALGVLLFLVTFSYRAGNNKASVASSRQQAQAADVMTQKAQAMAQAEADKPATEDALLTRLKDGNA
ncbi:hypothetical protein [Swingsia samuiensis]|uniref:Uncharacterized protein n=1 Tax=Swingsia samuiensis TaxID=1293412 RepID=A0A4Y6UJZ6_9PROT|nr:hypothetical protein [Swingsia samuiensis]QDH17384.1 hypothetical protein E3D00_07275 [Swingsia samuiensis]